MDSWCWSCGEGRVITDPDSGVRICNSCGREHDASVFITHTTFTADGHPDCSSQLHSVGEFGYRERKLHDATAVVSSLLISTLGLIPSRAEEALRLALDATDGELATASSAFLRHLAAASAYIVMRQKGLPLSLAEAASAVPCDPRDLAHLAGRLSRRLDLPPLPAFNAGQSLERAMQNSPSLSAADNPKKLISQGRFLLQCSTKWALTTGRHPLPMVAAVLFFVAKVNGLCSVSIDDIARDLRAGIATSRLRYKELTETLARVARTLLPWGEDVTAKNLVQNAPLLLQLMEMKTNSKPSEETSFLDEFTFDPSELANAYSCTMDEAERKYFQVVSGEGDCDDEKLKSLKLSGESPVSSYRNFLDRLARLKNPRALGKEEGNKKSGRKRGGLDIEAWTDSWERRLEADKNLSLKEIIGRDVGYDAPPPSFVSGKERRRLRRVKIESAKGRINEVMKPGSAAADLQVRKDECSGEQAVGRKRRKRKGDGGGVDWEDCIIEVLLLHRVDEEEIEQGQYNRLLDLHVFS